MANVRQPPDNPAGIDSIASYYYTQSVLFMREVSGEVRGEGERERERDGLICFEHKLVTSFYSLNLPPSLSLSGMVCSPALFPGLGRKITSVESSSSSPISSDKLYLLHRDMIGQR